MIRISVKGSRDQTDNAMRKRGIVGEFKSTNNNRSYWDVLETYRPKLVTWYAEPTMPERGVGYPPGTLLHHN